MKLTNAEQIVELPWAGNHAADGHLFNECEAFIKRLSDRQEQRRALYLMTLHGMGISKLVTNAVLDEYLSSD